MFKNFECGITLILISLGFLGGAMLAIYRVRFPEWIFFVPLLFALIVFVKIRFFNR